MKITLLTIVFLLLFVQASADTLSTVVGKKVAISVTADGTQPFTYQWMKNGVPIPGATSQTYVIASVTVNNLYRQGREAVLDDQHWGGGTYENCCPTSLEILEHEELVTFDQVLLLEDLHQALFGHVGLAEHDPASVDEVAI